MPVVSVLEVLFSCPSFPYYSGWHLVHMAEGPFTEFVRRVRESNREQQQVTVLISYFGKEIPFVFDFLQVEKI
jgi:hypothetical protein